MVGLGVGLEAVTVTALVGGFAYAACKDVQSREVSDGLWQLLGAVGTVVGFLAVAPAGLVPVVLWAAVAALALEHLFPWDEAFGEAHAGWVPAVELGAYGVVFVAVGYAAFRFGIGPGAVPVGALAAAVTVVLARGLFELGVLYGGADAKALIVAGLLVPVFAAPPLAPAIDTVVLGVLPFSVTLLTDAAVLSLVVPIAIGVRNVARGEFSFPRGFTSYTLAVEDLPRRFVWVRDPGLGADTLVDDAETSLEDTQRRGKLARELRARGVSRVWVTPQLPFLVLMAAGTFTGLLAGNLLLDLFSAL